MIRFRRSTHAPDGTVKPFSSEAQRAFTRYGFAVRLLSPDRAMTFDDYIATWRQYEREHAAAPDSIYYLLNSLRAMVQHGFIEAQEG